MKSPQVHCIVAVVLATILACLSVAAQAADTWNKPPFDRPLQVRRIHTGPSESTPGRQNEVRCFNLAHFVVKEIDHQEIGDEQISIIPLGPAANPKCQAANMPGERVFSRDAIADYFLGVKGDFVFLSAGDGVDRGLGFAVYRAADLHLVFQDSALMQDTRPLFRSIGLEADILRLRYARVKRGSCSVATDGPACWARIAKEVGLPPEPAPDCAAAYRQSKHDLAVGFCQSQKRKDAACITQEMANRSTDDQSPSVVSYDIEALLLPSGQAIHSAGGVTACWPAD